MSAKLQNALAAGKVVVRKKTSGSVIVTFRPFVSVGTRSKKNLKPFSITSYEPMDLTLRADVDVAALRNSNLASLVAQNFLEVI